MQLITVLVSRIHRTLHFIYVFAEMADHVTTLTSTGPDASPVTTALRGATIFNLTTTTGKHVQFL